MTRKRRKGAAPDPRGAAAVAAALHVTMMEELRRVSSEVPIYDFPYFVWRLRELPTWAEAR